VLAELQRDAAQWGGQVEFLDGGTQGLALLDRIAHRRALLVLDAVALERSPERFTFCAVGSHAGGRASTAHESNVAELLQTSMLLGECPQQVTVIESSRAHLDRHRCFGCSRPRRREAARSRAAELASETRCRSRCARARFRSPSLAGDIRPAAWTLEQLGYIAFMGGGSAAAGVTPNRAEREPFRAPLPRPRRPAPATRGGGDAVEQRQALGTAIQEFHLATPLGGIPL